MDLQSTTTSKFSWPNNFRYSYQFYKCSNMFIYQVPQNDLFRDPWVTMPGQLLRTYPSLKLTNSSPLKIGHPQKETSIPTIHFQGRAVSFRDGMSHLITFLNLKSLCSPNFVDSNFSPPNFSSKLKELILQFFFYSITWQKIRCFSWCYRFDSNEAVKLQIATSESFLHGSARCHGFLSVIFWVL